MTSVYAICYIKSSITWKIAIIGTSIHSTVLIVLRWVMVMIRVEATIWNGSLIWEPMAVCVLTSWVATFPSWGSRSEARAYWTEYWNLVYFFIFILLKKNSPICRIFGHILSSIWIANKKHKHSGNGSGCWTNVISRFAIIQGGFVKVAS